MSYFFAANRYFYSEDSEVVVVKKPQKRLRITFKGVTDKNSFLSYNYDLLSYLWLVSSLDESDRYLKFALQLLDHIRNVRLNREVSENIFFRIRVIISLFLSTHTRIHTSQGRRLSGIGPK